MIKFILKRIFNSRKKYISIFILIFIISFIYILTGSYYKFLSNKLYGIFLDAIFPGEYFIHGSSKNFDLYKDIDAFNLLLKKQQYNKIKNILNENNVEYLNITMAGGMIMNKQNKDKFKNIAFFVINKDYFKNLKYIKINDKPVSKNSDLIKSFLSGRNIILSKQVAEAIDVKIGDDVLLVVQTYDNNINMIKLKLTGITTYDFSKIFKINLPFGYINDKSFKLVAGIPSNMFFPFFITNLKFNQTNKKTKKHIIKIIKIIKKDVPMINIQNSANIVYQLKQILNIFKIILNCLNLILLFIASIILINTMFINIYQRKVEIGTFYSFGMKSKDFIALLFFENFFLIFLPFLFSLIVIFFLNIFHSGFTILQIYYSFKIENNVLLNYIFILFIISIVATIIPVFHFKKYPIIKLLEGI